MAMDPAGDFVVAWQSAAQDGDSFGVYAQRYDESTDTASPMVAGVFVDGKRVRRWDVIEGPVSQVIVSFSENVSDAGGQGGANSVTNIANWRIRRNIGNTTITGVPLSISYQFSAAANRFQATLSLDSSSTGSLQILALDNIRDIAGNPLDGDLNGAPGGASNTTFGIRCLRAARR
jgi:hypothetical protein